MSSGIYAIQNTVNGKHYVGSSIDIQERWSHHRGGLRANTHHSQHLQHAWNKYGEDAFTFIVLEECSPEQINDREQYWIAELQAVAHGYNKRWIANSNIGITYSAAFCARMSEIHKARMTPATLEQLRQQLRTLWNNPEYRAWKAQDMSRVWSDPQHKEERRRRMRATAARPEEKARKSRASRALYDDPAQRERASQQAQERWADPAFRALQAERTVNRWADPAQRQQHGQKSREIWSTPEFRERQAQAMQVVYDAPDYKEKRRAAIRKGWETRRARKAAQQPEE